MFTARDFPKLKLPSAQARRIPVAPGAVRFQLPIRTVNEVNESKHWRVRQRRASQQRHDTHYALVGKAMPALPCVVTMTRYAPRKVDSDSLPCCFKHIRDQIAAEYGVDDGDDSIIEWRYAQCPGEIKGYSVTVVIEPKEKACPNQAQMES